MKLSIVLANLIVATLCLGGAVAESGTLPDWMQPGVRLNSAGLERKLSFSFDDLGVVTDIQRGALRSPGTIELGIAGNYGARFLDERGNLNAVVRFEVAQPDTFRVSAKILGQASTNQLLFFRQAGPSATYDSLCDSHGEELWRTPYHPYTSAVADFGDQVGPEFFFGGRHGLIEARNLSGKVGWQTLLQSSASSIAPIRAIGSRPPEIIVDLSGTVVVLGPRGEILFQRKPAIPVLDLYPMTWPGICDAECLLTSTNQRFLLLKADGETVIGELPGKYVYQVHGKSIRVSNNEPPLLAIVGLLLYKGNKWAGLEAVYSELYIYDFNKHLVYDEVFPERAEALGALPRSDGKGEDLLVGGDNKVWQYSIVSGPDSKSTPNQK